VPAPTVQQPTAGAPADTSGTDSTIIRTQHALGLRREVLEASSLPIVEIDMQRHIRYANPAAIRLLGVPTNYHGMSIDEVFVDDKSKKLVDNEIERRRAGFIGNYRAIARRFSDGREIPLQITGLPITDDHGNVVTALGLFRSLEQQELTEAIRQLNRPDQTPAELLGGLAEILRRSIPFERLSVSRMSSDMNHVRSFFSTSPDGPALSSKRWWALTDAMKKWYATPGSNVIPDLEKFFLDPVWAPYKSDPAVQELLRAGIKSVLRRDVYRDGKIVCSVTLMSTELDGFSKEQEDLLLSAPVSATVLQAYHHFERALVAQRLDLLKDLNRCTTVSEACSTLASRLVDIFDWSHVSIFRVDRSARTLRLLAQYAQDKDPIRLPERYEQPFGSGILWRVITTGEAQNVGNVRKDPGYLCGVESGSVLSELCMPVRPEGEKDVRWVINVEDTQENAFSSDEVAALQEVAREVGGLMQRIADLFFLTQCFEHASEAIFVTDAHLGLRRVNAAAAGLLGYENTADVKGNLCDYLEDPSACARLSEPAPGDLGEFSFRQTNPSGEEANRPRQTVPVFVSRRDFPAGLTGSIFVVRDTSSMRKTVQEGVLAKAAYSVAVETCTPLSAAIAEIDELARRSPADEAGLRRVLRQLGRVRQGYLRLAMFNPEARPAASTFAPLNLQSELEALARNLADRGRIVVEHAAPGPLPIIQGDHFQIGFALETLLAAMLRYAPENEPVGASVSVVERDVRVRLRGYLNAGMPEQQMDAPWVPSDADMAIAKPLIDEFVQNHGGSWRGTVGADRRTEIEVKFPLSSQA
jgi:PAS domain S-box-containing protein